MKRENAIVLTVVMFLLGVILLPGAQWFSDHQTYGKQTGYQITGIECYSLAQAAGVMLMLRQYGARKSIVMQKFTENIADLPELQRDQILYEVSKLFDRDQAYAERRIEECLVGTPKTQS